MKIDFPNDWKILKIGNLHNRDGNIVQTGPFGAQLHSADYVKEGVPFILIRNFKNNRIDTSDMPFITEEDAERLKRYRLKEGDIIFSRVGRIGDTVYVEDYIDGWTISGQLLRIRSDDERIYNKFLNYIIKSDYVQRQINANYVGSTRKSLNTTILEQLKIPQPLINEQKKIVSILENADNLIQTTQQLIEKLQECKKGLMQRLFTEGIGHTEFKDTKLGRVPKEWNIKKLSELIELNPRYIIPGQKDYAYLPMDAIDKEKMAPNYWIRRTKEKLTTTKFKNGDILFAKITPCTENGKGALIKDFNEEIGFGSTELVVFSPKEEIFSDYLFYYTKRSLFRNRAISLMEGATGRQRVPKFFFKTQLIALPEYEEQKQIAKILSNIDNQITYNNHYNTKLKRTKKALMQVLLTGKKRVSI